MYVVWTIRGVDRHYYFFAWSTAQWQKFPNDRIHNWPKSTVQPTRLQVSHQMIRSGSKVGGVCVRDEHHEQVAEETWAARWQPLEGSDWKPKSKEAMQGAGKGRNVMIKERLDGGELRRKWLEDSVRAKVRDCLGGRARCYGPRDQPMRRKRIS